MPGIQYLQRVLQTNQADAQLNVIYGARSSRLEVEKKRYLDLLDKFTTTYPDQKEVFFFSSPGRTEVGGNHTDHNGGRVLAAAVDLDIVAIAAKRADQVIQVASEGYQPETIILDDLTVQAKEKFTSAALIRGVCARMKALGFSIGGFDVVIISRVPKGSGLSSSAAYEVLIATILDYFYNQACMDEVLKAQICQYAENQYFGKPCGLMDQTTCAVGGFVTIDFQDFNQPVVNKVNFDFSHQGYTLVIIDTGGSHADLNEDYAAIKNEMQSIARFFGGKVLREFSLEKVLHDLPSLREQVGDRAILRAMHFFQDDRRVVEQVNALEANDMPRFLQLVNESGSSSWKLLQNCYTPADIQVQSITLGLALSQVLLQGSQGACRVHGGGFAGTIQVFVPEQLLENYLHQMRSVFGSQACQELQIRPVGATVLKILINNRYNHAQMKRFLPGLLILLIAALAYLPLAHLLGFYNDDWYLLYMGLSQGVKRFMDVFAIDRPFRGYFVGWMFTLLGTHALWYTYAAFLARGLSAYGLYRIMRLTWPRERAAAVLAALLLIIYPGFLDQPNAVDYQSHQWSMVLAVFSIFCTLKAFQPGTPLWKRVFWLALSVIQQLFSLLLMEYYIGLEGLRLLLVWLTIKPIEPARKGFRIRQAILRDLPNLLVALGFFIWRAFFFNSGRAGTDVDTMLLDVAESPVMRVLWIAVFQVKDLLNTLFLAWSEPLYQLVFNMRLKNILLAAGVGVAGAFLAWLLLKHLQKDAEPADQPIPAASLEAGRQMIWIGLLSLLCALLPVHLGSRSVGFDSYSRFTLPASLGAVLVFAGVWLQIRSTHVRTWLPVALTGVAVMVHTGNTLGYVERWKLTKDFWWQVAWRAPQISQGTNLIASYADQGIAEDYFVWGPANLIYYPKLDFQSPTLLPLAAATLDKSNLQAVLAGRRQERNRRSILSEADFANTLVLSMPTAAACVHILDGRSPELSAQDRSEIYTIAPFSRQERIQVEAALQTPPINIFGAEPPHGWCYYYQKASLARQAGDWQEVARLGDEAQAQNLRPIDWVEWMPFVQAYAYTGQAERVSQLAPILKDDLYLRYQTCHLIEQDGRNEAELFPDGHQLLLDTFCQ